MSLPATDNFTGTGSLSGSWTTQNGTPQRATDEFIGASTDGDSYAFWAADLFDAAQYSQAVIKTTDGVSGANQGVLVRASGTGGSAQGYLGTGGANTTNPGIFKITAGVIGSALVTHAVALTTGDTLRLEIAGSTLTLKKNGTVIASVVDGSYATGAAGIYTYHTVITADDWEGGNLAQPFITRLEGALL